MGLLKTLQRRIQALGVYHRIQIRRPLEFLGDSRCGWTLCTEGLGRDSVIYSGGVGNNISFDRALCNRFGVELHAFDPTPQAIAFIGTRALPPGFHFHPWGLADYDGTARFNPNRDPRNPSHSLVEARSTAAEAVGAPVRRLSTVMKELGHDRLALLKLDIEGAEYGVLEDLLAAGLPIDQILVEFHHRFRGIGRRKTNAAIRALNAAGYRIAHVSDTGREYAFIRP